MTQNENIAEIANEIRSIKYAFIGKDREKVEALEKLALRVEALSLKGEEVNTCQNERCGATFEDVILQEFNGRCPRCGTKMYKHSTPSPSKMTQYPFVNPSQPSPTVEEYKGNPIILKALDEDNIENIRRKNKVLLSMLGEIDGPLLEEVKRRSEKVNKYIHNCRSMMMEPSMATIARADELTELIQFSEGGKL